MVKIQDAHTDSLHVQGIVVGNYGPLKISTQHVIKRVINAIFVGASESADVFSDAVIIL